MSVTQQGTLIATALFPLLLFTFPFFGLFIFIYMVPFLSFMLLIYLKTHKVKPIGLDSGLNF